MAAHANLWLIENIKRSQAKSIFLPAGQTPVALYAGLEDLQPDWLKPLQLLQIDDILSGPKKKLFQSFFKEHLPSFCDRFVWIDQANQIADLAILGFGKNGHVAFHEPQIRHPFFSGCVLLSEQTCASLELSEPTWGITYGVEAFLQCRAILLMIDGKGKETALKGFLERDAMIPASRLHEHPNLTVFSTVRPAF
jgi:6-phosphogluconolactonase/glucosamine-6-phosphate isomerase/deaminase